MNGRVVSFMIAATAVLFLTIPCQAGPASFDGRYDVDDLLERARKTVGLDNEDAVLLLDELREEWTADGRRLHSVHRVVWIGTARGIRDHADLRVPYDGARQKLNLAALRTWRLSDRRWIESGPTARVETLPFAVDHAPDYAHLREDMLLHDGVELPCVMETVYSIEDIEPYRAGMHGRHLLVREQPAVISRLVLAHPAGNPLHWASGGGLPDPVTAKEGTRVTLTFETGAPDPWPQPFTAEAVRQLPRVAWSSWADWDALGRDLLARFDEAAQPGEDLRGRLAERLERKGTPEEQAASVAALIAETTRLVDYRAGWWPAPRTAERTWATAYGNRIDRAVLGAALFRAAGLQAELVFLGHGVGPVDVEVAGLGWANGPGVRVHGGGFEGWFDPASAELSSGIANLAGRAVWEPGAMRKPLVRVPAAESPALIAVSLDLAYDAESASWRGTGVLSADGALSPFGEMAGLDGECLGHLGRLAGNLLDGAKVTGFSPAAFGPKRVVVGFDLELPAGERDAQGRLRLEVGAPPGVEAMLHDAAVHLHEAKRGSAVHLPGPVEQRVEIRLTTGDLKVVRHPEQGTLGNGAGRLVVATESDEDEKTLSVTRKLVLDRGAFAPGEWSELRALFLADGGAARRVLLFE